MPETGVAPSCAGVVTGVAEAATWVAVLSGAGVSAGACVAAAVGAVPEQLSAWGIQRMAVLSAITLSWFAYVRKQFNASR